MFENYCQTNTGIFEESIIFLELTLNLKFYFQITIEKIAYVIYKFKHSFIPNLHTDTNETKISFYNFLSKIKPRNFSTQTWKSELLLKKPQKRERSISNVTCWKKSDGSIRFRSFFLQRIALSHVSDSFFKKQGTNSRKKNTDNRDLILLLLRT